MKILGIETSCDETGVAIYDEEKGLIANQLYSQIEMHADYGGVVPELASRDHIRKTVPLIEAALKEAKANPVKFGELVRKYTGVQNGSTGETDEIPMSALAEKYAPISEAVKNAQKGQIIDNVIIVGDEAYIVKVLEKNPKGVVAFDVVKDQIKAQMKASKRQEETQKFMEDVTREFKLDKINKDTVKLPETKK